MSARVGALLVLVANLLGGGRAIADSPPPDAEADSAERWLLVGVGAPIGACAIVAAATNLSDGKPHPAWQEATVLSLFGVGATWGTSAGYYRGGMPAYATLSGLGRSALLAGGILLDRHAQREPTRDAGSTSEVRDDFPAFTVLGAAATLGWDLWDYFALEGSVRERHEKATVVLVPTAAAGPSAFAFGLAGTF
jgi:hypothetical protein